MFFSHQLLARKASLGQIWMAATMHAKFNRKKLNKINLIKICEEILNPSVPMALRLSGILMGGVVIVYERKVKLLYEDVTRLLVELNEAWKVRTVPDPTVLPKGRSKAKYAAVTLPDHNQDSEIREIEIQRTNYLTMDFDHINEEDFINVDLDPNHHQADPANITLFEPEDFQHINISLHHDQFERFDIEVDEDWMNMTSRDPSTYHTLVSSPHAQADFQPSQQGEPQQGEPYQEHGHSFHSHAADEIPNIHPQPQNNLQNDNNRDDGRQQDEQKPRPAKRKASRAKHLIMDNEQTIIPGHIYQSWLNDTSDIVSRRGRKKKLLKPMSAIKMTHLMELPPVSLIDGLPAHGSGRIHYPAPLLGLWMKFTQVQPPHDSPSGGGKTPLHPSAPSSSTPPYHQNPQELPPEGFHNGVSPQSKQPSMEIPLPNSLGDDIKRRLSGLNLGNSGGNEMSIPSSASGNDFMPLEPETELPGVPVLSGRLNMKRLYSSSRDSRSGGLSPVAEDNPFIVEEPTLKLRRISGNRPSPVAENNPVAEDNPLQGNWPSHDHEVLIETGPTQTPAPQCHQPPDKMTDTIHRVLKSHLDAPGAQESLDHLTYGMNRKSAALLFYQTCVLATRDQLKVDQKVPYGDILISKGPKM